MIVDCNERLRRLHLAALPVFLLLGLTAPLSAATSPATDTKAGAAGSPLPARVLQFLRDADNALKSGNLNLAVIDLKNAVQLAPGDGEVRARLGLALLQQGAAPAAERELRQASKDKAPAQLVIPGILQAMLMRNEANELLAEFVDPPVQTMTATAADILRARAIALQKLGRMAEASTAINRALKIRRDVPGLLTRATIAQQQKDLRLAREAVDEAVKRAPDNEQAFAMSVWLTRANGEAQKALSSIGDFLNRNPRSRLARILRVDVLLQLNDNAGAKQEVDTILKQDPKSLIGAYYDAVVAARTKDLKAAWQRAQTLPPEFIQSDPNIAVTVAQIATANGNTETGGAILAALISRHPDVAQARLLLAAIELRERHPENALMTLEPLKTSQDRGVQAVLAQTYLQLRRYAEAATALEQATASGRTDPQNELLTRQLAQTELQLGDQDKAIQSLEGLAARDPGNAGIAGSLTLELVRNGKFDEALTAANRFASAQPKSPMPPFYRGLVYLAQDKLAAALAGFGQSLAVDPKFVPALLYRSDAFVARGDPEAATKDLQQILAENPANISAYLKLAQIAFNNDRQSDLVLLLNRAIKAAPTDPAPRLALANYQISRGRYQDARATVDALLKTSSDNPDGLALLGQIQLATGAKENAIATFRALAASHPSLPGAQLLLANALSAAKDSVGAEAAAAKAVELDPASFPLQLGLIGVQIADGKPEAAVATARAYGSSHPGKAADVLLAETMLRLKRTNEAYDILKKSFAAHPDGDMTIRLSQMAVIAGDTKQAIAVVSDWLRKNPGDFQVRKERALLLLRAGEQDAARREFEMLLKERPDDPVALNDLAWIIQKTDPARSLSLITLAAKIAPRSADIVDTFGWIKLQQQDARGALPLLQRAHELDSGSPEIGYHLAVALDSTGKRADAKVLLQSILAKNAKFEDAHNAEQLVARW